MKAKNIGHKKSGGYRLLGIFNPLSTPNIVAMQTLRRYFLTLCCMSFFTAVQAQEMATQWNAVADSVTRWNMLRVQHKNDTAFVQQLFRQQYRRLTLMEQTPSSVSSFVFWQLPDSVQDALHSCWQAWCTTNGYTLVQQPADAKGFRRVSVYADKKKKQRIALYDRSALDATRITVGFSTEWLPASR